jgi:hypothetical protein
LLGHGAVISVVLDGLRHVHLALWWRWVRGDGATRDADSGCGAAVAHKIDSPRRILVPQVNHENEKSAIDFVHVDLGARGGVADKDADAGRGCDGTAVLVAETAHAGANWLLLDDEAVCTAIAHANVVAVVFAGLVCGCGGRLHLLLLLLLWGRLRGKLNGLALLELLGLLEGLALLDLLGRLLLLGQRGEVHHGGAGVVEVVWRRQRRGVGARQAGRLGLDVLLLLLLLLLLVLVGVRLDGVLGGRLDRVLVCARRVRGVHGRRLRGSWRGSWRGAGALWR